MAAADEGEGKAPHFQEAVEEAWKNRKTKTPGDAPGEYEVKKIVVVTENPIREYRVTIRRADARDIPLRVIPGSSTNEPTPCTLQSGRPPDRQETRLEERELRAGGLH